MKICHVAFEKCQRIERKHDAKTESGVGRILFEDANVPRRKASLDQQRKQQAGRPGANDVDSHGKLTTKVAKSTKLSNP